MYFTLGTFKDRGMHVEHDMMEPDETTDLHNNVTVKGDVKNVYNLPTFLRPLCKCKILRYIPVCPLYTGRNNTSKTS